MFLFNETASWHQVYDISTVGHEYGHILWCDEKQNQLWIKVETSKNIEEFKATTGGLISYFLDEATGWKTPKRASFNRPCKKEVLDLLDGWKLMKYNHIIVRINSLKWFIYNWCFILGWRKKN